MSTQTDKPYSLPHWSKQCTQDLAILYYLNWIGQQSDDWCDVERSDRSPTESLDMYQTLGEWAEQIFCDEGNKTVGGFVAESIVRCLIDDSQHNLGLDADPSVREQMWWETYWEEIEPCWVNIKCSNLVSTDHNWQKEGF